jgi:hypothetical protein
MSRENVEIVRRVSGAFAGGDFETITALVVIIRGEARAAAGRRE